MLVNNESIKARFGLTDYEIALITNAGFKFDCEVSENLHQIREHISIVVSNAVRNPSMTHTYQGHSDVDVSDQVINLVRLLRIQNRG